MALTPAERQRRRRAKLAADRAAMPARAATELDQPITRQEEWDAACDVLQNLLESYRAYLSTDPVPAGSLRNLDLPRLASLALTLALVEFPTEFADNWDGFSPTPRLAEHPSIDPRPLRQQLLQDGSATADPDLFPRTPEADAKAWEWWNRVAPDARPGWLRLARTSDPLDVWYIFRRTLEGLGG